MKTTNQIPKHLTEKFDVRLSAEAISHLLYMLEKEKEKIEIRIGVVKSQLDFLNQRYDNVRNDIDTLNFQLKPVEKYDKKTADYLVS